MKTILLFVATLAMSLIAFSAFAQLDPTPPPSVIPIDGGVGFLLAAGAAYGAKKILDFRNNRNN
jgi:hypothetical protein